MSRTQQFFPKYKDGCLEKGSKVNIFLKPIINILSHLSCQTAGRVLPSMVFHDGTLFEIL